MMLFHWWDVLVGELREHAKRGNALALKLTGEAPRSSMWPRVEKEHLAKQPKCVACGGAKRLQVHHMQPFHLKPELELDDANLITLCMGMLECHLRIGHGDDWRAYNPNVQDDAKACLAAVAKGSAGEGEVQMLAAKAKIARLYTDPK